MAQETVPTLEGLRALLVQHCMLQVPPEEIGEETPLFGPGGLGLDSIDALQLTVAVEAAYGVPIKDPETARHALRNLGELRKWIEQQQAARA